MGCRPRSGRVLCLRRVRRPRARTRRSGGRRRGLGWTPATRLVSHGILWAELAGLVGLDGYSPGERLEM